MDTKNQSYIVIEGLLSQTGEFEIRRGFEASFVGNVSNHSVGDETIVFSFLDAQDNMVYSQEVKVIFNHGCSPKSIRMGMAAIHEAFPLHPDAVKVEARFNQTVVFSEEIGSERPTLSEVKVNVNNDIAELSFDTEVLDEELTIYAQLKDDRLLRPVSEKVNGQFIVHLDSLAGLEEASIVVEATHKLRTTRSTSNNIPLPTATLTGMIMEPLDNSSWPYGKRGSLIASIYATNGRHSTWNKEIFEWQINKEPFGENEQIEGWAPKEPGDYHIQLVKKEGNGQTEIVDEVNVKVLPQTEVQKEYFALIERMQEAQLLG